MTFNYNVIFAYIWKFGSEAASTGLAIHRDDKKAISYRPKCELIYRCQMMNCLTILKWRNKVLIYTLGCYIIPNANILNQYCSLHAWLDIQMNIKMWLVMQHLHWARCTSGIKHQIKTYIHTSNYINWIYIGHLNGQCNSMWW